LGGGFCDVPTRDPRNYLKLKECRVGAAVAVPARMNPKAIALQERTHRFFIRVLRYCESLLDRQATSSIAAQLIDSAGSTDSNYRGACRGRSTDEFIAKIGVAAEEADESKGWLAALLARGYGDRQETTALIQEAHELTAIFTASQITARKRQAEKKRVEAEKKRQAAALKKWKRR
jgi:four helix bundle protein